MWRFRAHEVNSQILIKSWQFPEIGGSIFPDEDADFFDGGGKAVAGRKYNQDIVEREVQ